MLWVYFKVMLIVVAIAIPLLALLFWNRVRLERKEMQRPENE